MIDNFFKETINQSINTDTNTAMPYNAKAKQSVD